MGIPHYLAMTAAELSQNGPQIHTAWMACHVSPYHSGLSNLPVVLPPDSLLILDDSTPIDGHDPQRISLELQERIETLQCRGILLDFQRPDCPQAQALADHLAEALPCPVAVSQLYAMDRTYPVFLSPPSPQIPLGDYLQPWQGREIWLETALVKDQLMLTEEGCICSPISEIPEEGFIDSRLHCHYQVELQEYAARFTLWRTQEDVEQLLAEAQSLGVTVAVGLWQELHG